MKQTIDSPSHIGRPFATLCRGGSSYGMQQDSMVGRLSLALCPIPGSRRQKHADSHGELCTGQGLARGDKFTIG